MVPWRVPLKWPQKGRRSFLFHHHKCWSEQPSQKTERAEVRGVKLQLSETNCIHRPPEEKYKTQAVTQKNETAVKYSILSKISREAYRGWDIIQCGGHAGDTVCQAVIAWQSSLEPNPTFVLNGREWWILCSGYTTWSLCMNPYTSWSGDLNVAVKLHCIVTRSRLQWSNQDINVNRWGKMVQVIVK